MCGIPKIKLLGKPDDWKNLKARVEELKKFDLDFWISILLPVLSKLIDASEGKIDKTFWNCI